MTTALTGEGAVYPHGWTGSGWISSAVDPDGYQNVIVSGEDSTGTKQRLKTDTDGQIVVSVNTPKNGSTGGLGDTVVLSKRVISHAAYSYPQSGANINSDVFIVLELVVGAPITAPSVDIGSDGKVTLTGGRAGPGTFGVPTVAFIKAKIPFRFIPGLSITGRFAGFFDTVNNTGTNIQVMGFTNGVGFSDPNEEAAFFGFHGVALTFLGDPNPRSFCVGITRPSLGFTVASQANFNGDKLDGTGPSGLTIDFSKGNVFQIEYSRLGYDPVHYYVLNPQTSQFILFHTLKYGNTTTVPHTINAGNFRLTAFAMDFDLTASAAPVVSMSAAGMCAFSEAQIPMYGPPRGFTNTKNGTSVVPFAIRNSTTFPVGGASTNRQTMQITNMGFSNSGGSSAGVFKVFLNPTTLTGASYGAIDANTNLAEIDTSATAVSGGALIRTALVAANTSTQFDLTDFVLGPGDELAVEFSTAGTAADAAVAINWTDNF